MRLIETVHDLRLWRRREACERVVLVPTMGALHEGHLALVREARRIAGEHGSVLATVFVNPLQFGPNEDFERYPRQLDADLELCRGGGADAVFAPPVGEVYHADRSVMVLETTLSQALCGASRPGHFDGVCTVVCKLFNLTQPDDAVFGKKDFQQLAIIRRMVRDLDIPVTLHGVETVRERDGLAMSSRNRYLTEAERRQAPALRAALVAARQAWLDGVTGSARLVAKVNEMLSDQAPMGKVDYIAAVDASTLQPLDVVSDHGLIALAVRFGQARLIDNIELNRPRA